MDKDLEVLIGMRSFDVSLVLLRSAMRSVWIRCLQGSETIIFLLHGNHYSAPTAFHCDYVSVADDRFLSEFSKKLPDHRQMFSGKTSPAVIFHEGDLNHVIWCNSVTAIYPRESPRLFGLMDAVDREITWLDRLMETTSSQPLFED